MLFFGLSLGYGVMYAQNSAADFLFQKVNQLRDSLQLPLLAYDDVLAEAAYDQAYYMGARKKLTHLQRTFSKETVGDRVLFFGGNRTYVGENVASINSKKKLIQEELADSLFQLWFHSPGHYANMVHPQFTKMGLGLSQLGNSTYAAQVFSSNEIDYPKDFRSDVLSWGVRPNESECAKFTRNYNTMFFANAVQYLGSDIYFLFHDMKFFNSIISNDNDGLAIDVVLREQLPCGKENQFHGSPIYDGEMQRPVYRNDLFKNNISDNPKKIYTKIGQIPPHLIGKNWQANVIVVVDNHNCDYCIPVEVPTAIYPLLKVDVFHDDEEPIGLKVSDFEYAVHVHDSIHLALEYNRSDSSFVNFDQSDYARLMELQPYLKKIKVDCFASVEGETRINLKLLEQRKKAASEFLMLSDSAHDAIEWQLSENWDLMFKQIDSLQLSAMQGKSKQEIKDYLRKKRNDANLKELLDQLLFEQRKTHIYAWLDSTIVISDPAMIETLLYYQPDFPVHFLPWNRVLRDAYILPENRVPKNIVDSLIGLGSYRTNLLGALALNTQVLDSSQVEKELDMKKFVSNKQLFNYAHFLTHYWFNNFAFSFSLKGVGNTIKPEKLLRLIEALDKDLTLNQEQLDRLKVNVYLAGIHYYSAHSDWKQHNKYFDKIVEIVKSGYLHGYFSVQEAEGLALFFNHFYKFEGAVQLLEPYFDAKELTVNGSFILAKTATLIRNTLDSKRYFEFMMGAKAADKQRYCSWLNSSFQILRDEDIKADYCLSCPQ